MEDTFKRHRQTLAAATTTTATTNDRRRRHGADRCTVETYIEDEKEDLSVEERNSQSQMWNNFSNRFQQVQSVLDRNRSLIQQVNENHQSRRNDNMVQNVGLIQELNGNISQVVSLYSDLSTNFTTIFHQGNDAVGDETNNQRHH